MRKIGFGVPKGPLCSVHLKANAIKEVCDDVTDKHMVHLRGQWAISQGYDLALIYPEECVLLWVNGYLCFEQGETLKFF